MGLDLRHSCWRISCSSPQKLTPNQEEEVAAHHLYSPRAISIWKHMVHSCYLCDVLWVTYNVSQERCCSFQMMYG